MSLPPRRLYEWEGDAVERWQRRWRVPRLRVYHTIRSTNTLALRLAARGAPAGTTIIAEHQSAGRGRRGSPWVTPPGMALLMSTVARAPRDRARAAGPASIRVGLIAVRAIETVTGLEARLKWPNDVLAPDGRKIAGILCEGAFGPHGFLVVGIGINVLQTDDDVSPALRATAASIAAAGGNATAVRALLAGAILGALHEADDIAAPLAPAELDAIASRDALRGVRLSVDGAPAATGAGIAADGGLRIGSGGTTRVVYTGTITRAGAALTPHPDPRVLERTPQG